MYIAYIGFANLSGSLTPGIASLFKTKKKPIESYRTQGETGKESRIFAEIMRKFCERWKEKTLMRRANKKEVQENRADAPVGDARRIEFTQESGPWLLVPWFLELPEGRYEFPVLLPSTNSCVSSIYCRIHGQVCVRANTYTSPPPLYWPRRYLHRSTWCLWHFSPCPFPI